MAASAHTYKYQPSPPVSNFHMPRTKWSIKNGVGWLVYVGFWPKAFLALFAAYIHTRFNVNMYMHVYVYVLYMYVQGLVGMWVLELGAECMEAQLAASICLTTSMLTGLAHKYAA